MKNIKFNWAQLKQKFFLKENKIFIILSLSMLAILFLIFLFCFLSKDNLNNVFLSNSKNWLINNPDKNWNDWLSLSSKIQFGENYFFYTAFVFFLIPGNIAVLSLFLIFTISLIINSKISKTKKKEEAQ